jgi:hypothetical protein
MNPFRLTTKLAFLVILLGCSSSFLHAKQTGGNKDEPKKLKFILPLKVDGGLAENFYGAIELGAIAVDSEYEIEVEMTSPLAKPRTFAKVVGSCGCSTVRLDRNVFSSDEPTTATIKVAIPKSSSSGEFSFGFSIYEDLKGEKYIGQIQLRGDLAGNLEIDGSRGVFEISKKIETWRIPFQYSKPVEFDNIELEKSDSFVDIDVKKIEQDGYSFLELTAVELAIGGQGLSGVLSLSDNATGKKSTVDLVLVAKPKFKIRPQLIRFTSKIEKDEELDGTLVAATLIQFDDSDKKEKSGLQFEKVVPRFSCNLEGRAINTRVRKITETIFRVELEVPKSSFSECEVDHLNWSIDRGEKQFSAKTLFKVDID